MVTAHVLIGSQGRGYQKRGLRSDDPPDYIDDKNQSQDTKLGLLAAIMYSLLNTRLVGPTGVKVQGGLMCQSGHVSCDSTDMAHREPHTCNSKLEGWIQEA